ncbi:MAG: lyase family protein [Bacteroidota bacterium]
MSFRTEKDTMGEVQVPADKYWGAQTERSQQQLQDRPPRPACPKRSSTPFAYLKKAAAQANHELGVLTADKRDLIAQVCDEILTKKLDDQFPLVIWQTGSGTQSNMNVNEVIAYRAHVIHGGKLTDEKKDPPPQRRRQQVAIIQRYVSNSDERRDLQAGCRDHNSRSQKTSRYTQ